MKITQIIAKAKQAMHPETWSPEPFPPEWELRFTAEQLERLAIRTVDGCMSDDEALIAEGLA